MPLCHFDSYNLWILKPTHLNRGRGIHVFRDLDTLHKLIKQYCSGRELKKFNKQQKNDLLNNPLPQQPPQSPAEGIISGALTIPPILQINSNTLNDEEQAATNLLLQSEESQSVKKPTASKVKFNTFIIQKYIEKPLLIHKRKFDIRVWVCLT